MSVCFSGDLEDADRVLAPLRALSDPVVDLLQEQPYTQVPVHHLDAVEPKGNHYYWKTEYAAQGCSDDLLATGGAWPGVPVRWRRWGSSTSAVPSTSSTRTTGQSKPGRPLRAGRARHVGAGGAGRGSVPAVGQGRVGADPPLLDRRQYINLQTADDDDQRIRAAYGGNFDRLVKIKEEYDPGNVFRSNRNVRTRAPSGSG